MSFWTQPKPNSRFHRQSVLGYVRHSEKEIEIRLTHKRTVMWTGHPKRIDHLEKKVQQMIAFNKAVAAKNAKTKRKSKATK